MRVAGFGFRQNASLASLQAAFDLTGGADALATAEDQAARSGTNLPAPPACR